MSKRSHTLISGRASGRLACKHVGCGAMRLVKQLFEQCGMP